MSEALPACWRCGGSRRADAPIWCTFCGAKQQTGVSNPAAYRTLPERYALVEKQPGYAKAMEQRPRLPAVRVLGGVVGASTWIIGVTIVFIEVARRMNAPMLVELFGFGFATTSALVCMIALYRAIRRVLARTDVGVFVITNEGGGELGDSALDARHRLDLRARDGTMRRVFASDELIGGVVPGDIGVGCVQYDRLLDYRWFDVMPPTLPANQPPRAPSCQACAAPLTFGTKRACTYCGATLADPDLGEHGATFEALAASEAGTAALARTLPEVLPRLAAPIAILASGGAAACVLVGMRTLLDGLYALSPYTLLVILPPAIAILLGAWGLVQRLALRRRPREVALAVILRRRRIKQRQVIGQQVDRHLVTVAAANGARRELRVMRPLLAADGSFGVAHVRGELLTAFEALPHLGGGAGLGARSNTA